MMDLLDSLDRGNLVTFESITKANEFHDFLILCGRDPDDYRRIGLDVWKA